VTGAARAPVYKLDNLFDEPQQAQQACQQALEPALRHLQGRHRWMAGQSAGQQSQALE